MNNLAPIVLFVYNRPWHTEQTLQALKQNKLAKNSILYVFADGCKDSSNKEEKRLVEEVRSVIRKGKWCGEVHIIESDENRGLADSIILGVTDIVNKYNKVIVLEDDIVTSNGFLAYMNDALDLYEKESNVMSVSGYMFPHKKKLTESFFYGAPFPWGWATWKRAWSSFNNNADELYKKFEDEKKWNMFNKFGGKLLQKQLKSNVDGEIKTWYVKWHASLVSNHGLTLYPGKSLVNNIGFDDSGVHCATVTIFDHDKLRKKVEVKPIELKENKLAKKIIVLFYQGKWYYIKHLLIRLIPNFIKTLLKRIL